MFVGQNKKEHSCLLSFLFFDSGTLPKMMSCMASQSNSKKECYPEKTCLSMHPQQYFPASPKHSWAVTCAMCRCRLAARLHIGHVQPRDKPLTISAKTSAQALHGWHAPWLAEQIMCNA